METLRNCVFSTLRTYCLSFAQICNGASCKLAATLFFESPGSRILNVMCYIGSIFRLGHEFLGKAFEKSNDFSVIIPTAANRFDIPLTCCEYLLKFPNSSIRPESGCLDTKTHNRLELLNQEDFPTAPIYSSYP